MDTDFTKHLAEMALAIRLRRISDSMVRDGHKFYKSIKANFEPNWFLLFLLLKEQPLMSITEIANALGFTHPAINSMVARIMRKGYLEEVADEQDKRRRLVRLSTKGLEKQNELEIVWQSGRKAMQKLVADNEHDLMAALGQLEKQLQRKSFYQRLVEELSEVVPVSQSK